MQFHLDLVGGIAGDMFIAALVHAYPEHEAGVLASIRAVGLQQGADCRFAPYRDGALQGRRFVTGATSPRPDRAPADSGEPTGRHGHRHGDLEEDPHGRSADAAILLRHSSGRTRAGTGPHQHTAWASIQRQLEGSSLHDEVKKHAVAIFSHLATAEAQIHGVAPDDVEFHEVGAWDSIADIVGAAHLIAAVSASSWSVSPIPLGSGRIQTRHGLLPVPAPATALLLEGFLTVDDGFPGERVTPTGAAILRHLCLGQVPARTPRKLMRSGIGFGSRKIPGLSNCLRVLAFEETRVPGTHHRELAVLEFEVDDQSPEELAVGLDRLRMHTGVLEVVQAPVFGKKGRMLTYVRLIARPERLNDVIDACFQETTTIGLRHRIVEGAALRRQVRTVEVAGRGVRVKVVDRPGGPTAKAESDDVLNEETHAARAQIRRRSERLALDVEPFS